MRRTLRCSRKVLKPPAIATRRFVVTVRRADGDKMKTLTPGKTGIGVSELRLNTMIWDSQN